jgi:hypothetical protein
MMKRLLILLAMVGVCLAYGLTSWLLLTQPATEVSYAQNTFLTISMVAYEQLRVLFNQLKFTRNINRQFDSMFAVSGAKIGATVNARKPPRYVVNKGQLAVVQNMTETPVPIVLTDQANIALGAATADFALSIDDFSNRFLRPAAIAIANQMDFDGTSRMTPLVWNHVGTPGTAPTTADTYLRAGVKLDNGAAPNGGDRCFVVNPDAQRAIVNGLTATFNPTKQISEQYLEGSMGKALGGDWYMDQNVFSQTVGVIVGAAATVNGANQGGNGSIITAGWTSGDILNAGDIVSFAGCNAVNPQNRQSTGQLAQFTVTATATASGAGAMTITFTPPINATPGDQFQNCSAFPTTTGAVRVYDLTTTATYSGVSTPQNLFFHPDFCTLVTAPLPVYDKGVVEGYRVDAPELGISLRVIKFYTGLSDQLVTRIDVLYGWALLYGELACRVSS